MYLFMFPLRIFFQKKKISVPGQTFLRQNGKISWITCDCVIYIIYNYVHRILGWQNFSSANFAADKKERNTLCVSYYL